MSFENALITRVCDSGEWRTVRDKIGPEHFTDVLSQAAWRFVVQHALQHGAPPSRDILRDQFPTFVFEASSDPPSALADRLHATHIYNTIAVHTEKIMTSATSDPLAAAELAAGFGSTMRTMLNRGTGNIGVDVTKQMQEERDVYRMRAENRGIIGWEWPWPVLNRRTLGAERGSMYAMYGRPKTGKAQPHDARVLTPHGFVRMGDLRVGDHVIGANGAPTRVLGVFERGVLPCYRVRTVDGGSTVVAGDHLWLTTTRNERRRGHSGTVRSTDEIRATLHRVDGGYNHAIPHMAPARFTTSQPMPIDPYLLGVYLGDGCTRSNSVVISNTEPDIRQRCSVLLPDGDEFVDVADGSGYRVRHVQQTTAPTRMKAALQELGLFGLKSSDKYIPMCYLQASVEARVALLRGLMDTDGYVEGPRSIEYSTSSKRLADDVAYLVGGLGGCSTWAERLTSYVKCGERVACLTSYRGRITFHGSSLVPVASDKHLARWEQRVSKSVERTIVAVDPVGDIACRCIQVEAADGLYVTDNFIVTHNTFFLIYLLAFWWYKYKARVHLFGREMRTEQLRSRFVATVAGIDYERYTRGQLTDAEYKRWWEATEVIEESHSFYIDGVTTNGAEAADDMFDKAIDTGADVIGVDGAYFFGERDWEVLAQYTQRMKSNLLHRYQVIAALTTQAARQKAKGGDDVAYGDSLLQDVDMLIKMQMDPDDLSRVHAATAGVRDGRPASWQMWRRPCIDFGQAFEEPDEVTGPGGGDPSQDVSV